MTDEQSRLTGPLTPLQRTRLDYARLELERVHAEDLALLDASHLILIVEQLRGRLTDMLDLITEISHDTPTGRAGQTDHHP